MYSVDVVDVVVDVVFLERQHGKRLYDNDNKGLLTLLTLFSIV
jgi:hypothetical protein